MYKKLVAPAQRIYSPCYSSTRSCSCSCIFSRAKHVDLFGQVQYVISGELQRDFLNDGNLPALTFALILTLALTLTLVFDKLKPQLTRL